MRNFKKTLHEEVFSKKVGLNPPLILNPEEVPIVSEVLDESVKSPNKVFSKPAIKREVHGSDDEVKPENYLFSSDC